MNLSYGHEDALETIRDIAYKVGRGEIDPEEQSIALDRAADFFEAELRNAQRAYSRVEHLKLFLTSYAEGLIPRLPPQEMPFGLRVQFELAFIIHRLDGNLDHAYNHDGTGALLKRCFDEIGRLQIERDSAQSARAFLAHHHVKASGPDALGQACGICGMLGVGPAPPQTNAEQDDHGGD